MAGRPRRAPARRPGSDRPARASSSPFPSGPDPSARFSRISMAKQYQTTRTCRPRLFAVRWLGALLPLAMTLTVVAAGIAHTVGAGGIYREADEGTAAHLFQILMPLQVPIIIAFAATQLPRHAAWATTFLVLQIGLAAALFATVFAFQL